MSLCEGQKRFVMLFKEKYFPYFQQIQRNKVNQRYQVNRHNKTINKNMFH